MIEPVTKENSKIASITAKILFVEAIGLGLFLIFHQKFDIFGTMVFYHIALYGYGAFNFLFLILLLIYRPRFWGWLILPLIVLPLTAFPILLSEWMSVIGSLIESLNR